MISVDLKVDIDLALKDLLKELKEKCSHALSRSYVCSKRLTSLLIELFVLLCLQVVNWCQDKVSICPKSRCL